MGSEYQKVQVIEIDGKKIRLTITECHPDMEALHLILTEKDQEYSNQNLVQPLENLRIPESKKHEAGLFAGQILCDYGESTEFYKAAYNYHEEEECDPEPFFDNIKVLEIKPLYKGTNNTWLYQAVLQIEVMNYKWLKDFIPGTEYYSRACPTGDWEVF
ncbi:MAG: hypothetical protein JXB88_02780 [Spirochaetales bacterium]|nr:hypothetical protein [Spirochaetales bacterium]